MQYHCTSLPTLSFEALIGSSAGSMMQDMREGRRLCHLADEADTYQFH
jgi:hypothetical protein